MRVGQTITIKVIPHYSDELTGVRRYSAPIVVDAEVCTVRLDSIDVFISEERLSRPIMLHDDIRTQARYLRYFNLWFTTKTIRYCVNLACFVSVTPHHWGGVYKEWERRAPEFSIVYSKEMRAAVVCFLCGCYSNQIPLLKDIAKLIARMVAYSVEDDCWMDAMQPERIKRSRKL